MNHNNHIKTEGNPEIKTEKIYYADDDRTPIKRLVIMRIIPLGIGFLLGILLPFIVSRFEDLLTRDLRIAFFIPFIVYMADAVATQTESIYVRDLKTGRANFKRYLAKEAVVGLILGVIAGSAAGLVAFIWFSSIPLALAVLFGMTAAVATAPMTAMMVSEILELERTDPAVGAGPITAVFQDAISVTIFGLIATLFL